MIKLSIIIPFKNSGKNIIKTLKSIKQQKIVSNEYEVLLINDFSDKKDLLRVEKQIKNHKNFKLFNSKKKTIGPGHARNLGVKYSLGKYILFLDSDDCLNKNALKKILKIIDKINCDIFAFRFKIQDTLNVMHRKSRDDLHLLKLNKKEIYKKYLDTSIIPQIISNLFLREFLKKNTIKFKEGYFEDILFFLKSIYFSNLIVIDKNIFYIKNNVKNSIVNSISEKHIFDHFNAYSDTFKFLKKKIKKIDIKKLNFFYVKGIVGLTSVYIIKATKSQVTNSKKNMFFSIIYKLYSKILLDSKVKYVYKTDKDKFVKNFYNNF